DIVVLPAPYGKAPVIVDKFQNVVKNMTFPLYHLKPTFPMPSGGITPTVIPKLIEDLGTEVMIGSGGGIHAHPDGPIAGARAFRQAIDAVLQGIPLTEAAKAHPELAKALEEWKDPFGKGLLL
ncbi:MAG TPA: ribulose 1,5-bisphosphate carboxylase, partial [Bacteroidetes bacterium]|nr:ribulose 1,5-bisphosphate carboxylase [Bacteroidota bacterium]